MSGCQCQRGVVCIACFAWCDDASVLRAQVASLTAERDALAAALEAEETRAYKEAERLAAQMRAGWSASDWWRTNALRWKRAAKHFRQQREALAHSEPAAARVVERLKRISEAPCGWAGEGAGAPVDPETIAGLVAHLPRLLSAEGLTSVRLFPSTDGSVLAEWVSDPWCIAALFDATNADAMHGPAKDP